VLPRIGGRRLWRTADHDRGHPYGILIYPLAVLGLVLFFHDQLWMAAAVWGILAWGDGMASILGQALGGPRLPWNERNGWAGVAAFAVFGTIGSAVFVAFCLGMPLGAWASPQILSFIVPVTLLCALVESVPTTLDDNLTVPLVGALTLWLIAPAEVRYLW